MALAECAQRPLTIRDAVNKPDQPHSNAKSKPGGLLLADIEVEPFARERPLKQRS